MRSWQLECVICRTEHPQDFRGFRCPCGGALDVRFTPSPSRINLGERASLWRYREAIPIEDDRALVSLGEGLTPVFEEVLDEEPVLLKVEYQSPTGSFKDRGASVLISRLQEMGVGEILEDSSGNAACSLAAYAAAAGIRCRVLVPEGVAEEKAVQIAHYGAAVERIPGSRDEVAAEAIRRSRETFYASHNWQPFFLQGTKTFAYEIFEQRAVLPAAIVFPIGNGSLILGSFKGFRELIDLGWIEKMPRLIGVQAASHSPVHSAVGGVPPPAGGRDTIAKGIAVRQPVRLQQIVEAVRASGGTVVVVEDDEIRSAQRDLARRGFLTEPTAAAAFAGYRAWRRNGGEPEGDVLIPLTGWGLKDTASLERLVEDEERRP